MTDLWADARQRAGRYAVRNSLILRDELGAGYDGIVFNTDADSAVKSLRFEGLYRRERDVYMRLWNAHVEVVAGCTVPRLLNFDDELWVVETEVVKPPYALDFAGAYLDRPPDYPEEVLAEWEAEKREQFGNDWPRVLAVMSGFRRLGIYLADVKPGNIQFE